MNEDFRQTFEFFVLYGGEIMVDFTRILHGHFTDRKSQGYVYVKWEYRNTM